MAKSLTEETQRKAWDELLLDIEHRTEQLRQMKGASHEKLRQMKTYEPWRLAFAGMTAGAALFAAGAAFVKVFGG